MTEVGMNSAIVAMNRNLAIVVAAVLFLAVSADDPLLADASQPVFAAWRAQKRPAELHVYEKGGHGYGLNKSGATSDHWIDAFYWWLEAGGFIKGGM
jgi:acetyl esterase/lipase